MPLADRLDDDLTYLITLEIRAHLAKQLQLALRIHVHDLLNFCVRLRVT